MVAGAFGLQALSRGEQAMIAASRRLWTALAPFSLCVMAAADGFVATSVGKGASEAAQRAIILDLGHGDQTLVLQITYSGDAGDFAWVVPVPTMPRPDGITRAPDWLVQKLFEATAPTVHTEGGHEGYQSMKAAEAGGYTSDRTRARPSVVVWQTLQVGPYTAQVLQATGPGVLPDWLNRHGYKMPEKAARVLDEYVAQRWFFVALRITRPSPGRRLQQGDLPPLAITFPRKTAALVYPLTISRASARERCAVDLIIVAPSPVRCRDIEFVTPPKGRLGRTTIWNAFCEQTDNGCRALLLWRSQWTPLPPGSSLNFVGAQPNWQHLWCQRVWMWLKPEQMRDLRFEPVAADVSQVKLNIYRRAYVNQSLRSAKSFAREQYFETRYWLRRRMSKLIWSPIWYLLIVVVTGLGVGVVVVLLLRRIFGGFLGLLILLAAAAVVSGVAVAGMGVPGESWAAWDSAAGEINRAILRFADCFGAYPLRASDLLSQRPRYGQDASGNKVRLSPSDAWRPLRALPIDPYTQKRTTWLIDLAAPELVASKRMAIGISVLWPRPERNLALLPAPLLSPRSGQQAAAH